MTAEIVIMNKEAVAIAADSAVSLMGGSGDRPQKIFTSATKIFRLSQHQSACIMIYNNAMFMGIPWETIIHAYKTKLGNKTFPSLDDYANDFIAFLGKEEDLVPVYVEENYFFSAVYRFFLFLRYLIQDRAAAHLREKGAISEEELQQIIAGLVSEVHTQLESARYSPSMDEAYYNDLLDHYDEVILKASRQVFENLPINNETYGRLEEIAVYFFVKVLEPLDPLHQDYSGVVVTGFGEKDLLPSLKVYSIEGKFRNRLKFAELESQKVTFENGAMIIPLAQREMVDIFLSGMDPRFEESLVGSLSSTFHAFPEAIIDSVASLQEPERAALKEQYSKIGDDLTRQLQERLDRYRMVNFTPIVNVVAALPKSELASLAESLVNLTSLKRRVSLQAETVAGPVDVAVISKADGFLWIKRKQYFDPALNARTATEGGPW